MSDKFFINQSSFSGVREFDTPDGMMRFERDGVGYAGFVQRGNAFVRIAWIKASKHESNERLYDLFTSRCDELNIDIAA